MYVYVYVNVHTYIHGKAHIQTYIFTDVHVCTQNTFSYIWLQYGMHACAQERYMNEALISHEETDISAQAVGKRCVLHNEKGTSGFSWPTDRQTDRQADRQAFNSHDTHTHE
jgi:hypothetical protein